MNILALFGTVWLFTTPALGHWVTHDRIGFLGASVVELPDGVTNALVGQDDALGGEFPAVGLQYASPIDGSSTEMIVVEAPFYCEAFVIKHHGRKRMRGIAVMFDPTCQRVEDLRRYQWYARKLDR